MSGRKWTKDGPGRYVSGTFLIEGSKTSWTLRRDGKVIEKNIYSKKSAQEMVDNNPDVGIPKPPPPPRPSKDNLESVIASFRLEVSRLADMIGLLAVKIDELARKLPD